MAEESEISLKNQVLAMLETFERLSKADPAEVDLWSLKRLADIWRVARASSSFWRDRLPKWAEVHGSTETITQLLARLPITSRSEFQNTSDFSSVWLPGSNAIEYVSVSTSGSTGKPVRVLKHAPRAKDIFHGSLQGEKPLLTFGNGE